MPSGTMCVLCDKESEGGRFFIFRANSKFPKYRQLQLMKDQLSLVRNLNIKILKAGFVNVCEKTLA